MAKYPILYAPDATDFFNMGLGPITTSLTATVSEERNGSFILEAEVLTDDVIYPLIEYNGIIKADAGHKLKDQRFRIKRVVPTEDGKAQIYAEHVSYLTQELSMKPEVQIVSLDAIGAVAQWKNALNEPNQFVIDSDIKTVGSTNWRIDKVANPRQALGGVEGSLLDIYGGEYRFDNYHISLLKKRGTTANTVLAYGRNIKTFEQEKNITATYTSVYPYAVYKDGNDVDVLVTIDGYTVHCANIAAFPNPVVKVVDFSSEFDHEEIPTKAKLKSLAESYIIANEFGVPSVSIKVSFVDLSKTADYAEYEALEELDLCDDVRVIFPKLGVDTVSKVTRTVWNVLSESHDEIEIGERRASLSTIINDQGKQIGKAEENANNALVSANGKNTTFYGLYGTDGLGEPKANKVGDLWYKPNGDETEMYQWNGTIWEFIMSTAPDPELQKAIEEVGEKVEQAQSDANQALTNANDAVSKATNAAAKADQSSAAAAQAQVDATSAMESATKAFDDAKDALDGVDGLRTDLTTEVTRIDGVLVTKVSQTDFNGLEGTVSAHSTQISQNTTDIKLKASITEVNALSGRVSSTESQLSVQAGTISALNTLTDGHTAQIGNLTASFDGLSSTVSKVQTDLAGKASVTDFSNLSQTVSVIQGTVANKAEQSQVTQLAGQISSLISDRKLNLLVNSDFREGTTGWSGTGMSTIPIASSSVTENNKIGYQVQKYLRPTMESLAGESAFPVQVLKNPSDFKGKKINFAFSYTTVGGFTTSPMQASVRYTLDGVNYYVAFSSDPSRYLDISASWKRVSAVLDLTGITASQELSDIRLNIGFIASRFTSTSQRCLVTAFQATEDGNMYQWGYEYCLGVDYAQTTMLKDLINLRVTKDDVVNQINISPDGVLIAANKVQITGQTYIESGVIKTAHIADAAITNAKIGSLSADKVTVGTLNGANVNIINLNASNIVSGEISGINIRAATFYGTSENGTMQLNGTGLRFDTTTNSFRLNYGGISNVNTTYGTRDITFFSEGIEVASGASNTGNYKNSGVRVNGSTAYVDLFSSKSVTTTDYATRLVAETNGNFGVLNPKGLVYISSPAAINLQPGTSVNINKPLEMGGNNINGANNLIGSTSTGGSKVNMINVQGSGSSAYLNITSGSTSWGVTMWTSDMRLKTNIQKAPDNGLELVDQLMVRAFDWRDSDRHTDYGLIAQNVERVLPQAVFDVVQSSGPSIKQISVEGLVPILVKAIQELKQEINTLKESA